jgi:hypothetical protein
MDQPNELDPVIQAVEDLSDVLETGHPTADRDPFRARRVDIGRI